jgi:hypothetical protein
MEEQEVGGETEQQGQEWATDERGGERRSDSLRQGRSEGQDVAIDTFTDWLKDSPGDLVDRLVTD